MRLVCLCSLWRPEGWRSFTCENSFSADHKTLDGQSRFIGQDKSAAKHWIRRFIADQCFLRCVRAGHTPTLSPPTPQVNVLTVFYLLQLDIMMVARYFKV